MSDLLGDPLRGRTSVELFAGGGGLAMAVHQAGFRPLLVNEIVRYACDTLKTNAAATRGEDEWIPTHGDRWPLVEGDVRQVDFSYLWDRVDLIAGGPPCQPFSLGGVAKGDEDKRNMFPEMFRAVREIQPKAVICENVRGLLRQSFRPYFDYIERELQLPFEERDEAASWQEHDEILRRRLDETPSDPKQRYQVRTFPVNAADYGVPQIRNRIIMVAFRSDLGVDLDRFEQSVSPTHSESALARTMLDGTYWDRHPGVPGHVRRRVMSRLSGATTIADDTLPWRTLRDAIAGDDDQRPLPPVPWDRLDRQEHLLGGFTNHIGWPGARIYAGHTPNELDRPAKTVKAGVHGVPGGESVMLTDDLDPLSDAYRHRYMTVRETARVMTFPDDWKLAGPRGEQMRQLGNAVPVVLGEFFARKIAEALDEANQQP
ncbi:DNA cytosine methyltransferase [Micromonospora sp. NBC_01813]|uniref:DNA cytosine methyltransferase n=1 Tax=Micromonospora sp. NBC_01813 TaxID=2975988 RepID=UPI002DD88DAE|nr:DNA cytosine methyltransferase [Micromonospora sp. NBC_01813]WSA08140.1 DNA cytosine methyltransferase [Micromonospora sp. NBC_01813]